LTDRRIPGTGLVFGRQGNEDELNITYIVRIIIQQTATNEQSLIDNQLKNRTTYEQAKSAGIFEFFRHLPQQEVAGFATSVGQISAGEGGVCQPFPDALSGGHGLCRGEPN